MFMLKTQLAKLESQIQSKLPIAAVEFQISLHKSPGTEYMIALNCPPAV